LTDALTQGISLSGGQKQRINICRAIYCNTDIQIFDDPLSALDAHVGKAVFQNVLKSNTEKTRILVTHALHFLPEVDYIYTLVDGRIAERGTYAELMANDGAFSKFVEEFGSKEDSMKKEEKAIESADIEEKKPQRGTAGKTMMQEEERNTGAIKWDVYREYLTAAHGTVLIPLLLVSLLLMQGSSVMSSYWWVISLCLCHITNTRLQACLLGRIVRVNFVRYTYVLNIFIANGPNLKDFMSVFLYITTRSSLTIANADWHLCCPRRLPGVDDVHDGSYILNAYLLCFPTAT